MAEDMTTSFCLHLFWGDDEQGGAGAPSHNFIPFFQEDVSILPPLCLRHATAVSHPCLSKTGE